MKGDFERVFSLADVMFGTLAHPRFLTLIKTDGEGRDVDEILARWAGGIKPNSNGAMYGPWKAFSLLAKGNVTGVSMTPIPHFKDGCPYRGGFRNGNLIVSVSGYENDVIDLMFATLFYKCLLEEVRLHHIGFAHSTREGRDRALAERGRILQTQSISKPALDHERDYTTVETSLPNGMFWIEDQFWYSKINPEQEVHVDVATLNPESFIQHLAFHTGLTADIWQRQPNSPCAMIRARNTDGLWVSIMARPAWTPVGDW